MKAQAKLFTFRGAPIYAHISVLLVFYVFYLTGGFWVGMTSGLAFFGLLIAHEIGHGYFAHKYGHPLLEIRIFPLHGITRFYLKQTEMAESLVYAGGLLVQLLILCLWAALLGIMDVLKLSHIKEQVWPLTNVFIRANIITIVINSMPFPGLDGHFLWKSLYRTIRNKQNTSASQTLKQATMSHAPCRTAANDSEGHAEQWFTWYFRTGLILPLIVTAIVFKYHSVIHNPYILVLGGMGLMMSIPYFLFVMTVFVWSLKKPPHKLKVACWSLPVVFLAFVALFVIYAEHGIYLNKNASFKPDFMPVLGYVLLYGYFYVAFATLVYFVIKTTRARIGRH